MISRIFITLLASVILTGFTIDSLDLNDEIAQLKKEKKLVALMTDSLYATKTTNYSLEKELGEELFHDKMLSKNRNISCASCHIPDKGFSNGEEFSVGTNGNTLTRHVPHLFNLSFNESFFWDGRASSLEEQLHKVLQSKEELDMNIKVLISRLKESEAYEKKFREAYPGEGISKRSITKAIVAYEKSIMSVRSRYDLFLMGDTAVLSSIEKQGFRLFIGKANCIACHRGPNLTDNSFHNVGVRTNDLGRHAIDKVGMKNEFESTPYPFFSMYKAFKTPSLRNAPLTAPYFHNGSKNTLEDVIEFYNKGGENRDQTGLAKEIKPLNLSEMEKRALRAFINTLCSADDH